MNETKQKNDLKVNFIKHLNQLLVKDNVEAINCYRRCLKLEDKNARRQTCEYKGCTPYKFMKEFFFIGGLFMEYKNNTDKEYKKFGGSCRELYFAMDKADLINNYFRNLLTLDNIDTVLIEIKRLISRMTEYSIKINYSNMLSDIMNWHHKDEFVQDKLALSFWKN